MSYPHPELTPPPPLDLNGLRVIALGGLGEIGHHAAQIAESLGAERRGDPLVQFFGGQPPLSEMLAQPFCDAFPLGV